MCRLSDQIIGTVFAPPPPTPPGSLRKCWCWWGCVWYNNCLFATLLGCFTLFAPTSVCKLRDRSGGTRVAPSFFKDTHATFTGSLMASRPSWTLPPPSSTSPHRPQLCVEVWLHRLQGTTFQKAPNTARTRFLGDLDHLWFKRGTKVSCVHKCLFLRWKVTRPYRWRWNDWNNAQHVDSWFHLTLLQQN